MSIIHKIKKKEILGCQNLFKIFRMAEPKFCRAFATDTDRGDATRQEREVKSKCINHKLITLKFLLLLRDDPDVPGKGAFKFSIFWIFWPGGGLW